MDGDAGHVCRVDRARRTFTSPGCVPRTSNPDGFRFTVYRKNMFSDDRHAGSACRIFRWIDEPFDRDFIIKGTDEARVRQLFSNPTIRDLIARQPSIHLSVRDDEGWFGVKFPEGVDELLLRDPGRDQGCRTVEAAV